MKISYSFKNIKNIILLIILFLVLLVFCSCNNIIWGSAKLSSNVSDVKDANSGSDNGFSNTNSYGISDNDVDESSLNSSSFSNSSSSNETDNPINTPNPTKPQPTIKPPAPTRPPIPVKWIDLKYAAVPVPQNVNLLNSQNIIEIESLAKNNLILKFSNLKVSEAVRVFIWIDSVNYSLFYENDFLYAKYKPNSLLNNGTLIRKNSAMLLIISLDNANPYLKILNIDLTQENERLKFNIKENTVNKLPAESDQFRIISPRYPMSKEDINSIPNLIKFSPMEFSIIKNNGYKLNPICIEPLLNMFRTAKTQGISKLVLKDTYRTYDFQKSLFQKRLQYRVYSGMSYEQAYIRTDFGTAFPGTSEHHGGLTVDVSDTDAEVTRKFENAAFGQWISMHAHEFGFTIRYPKGKESITTKMYEPWHIRYVGQQTAYILKNFNFVMEEFAALLYKNKLFVYSYKDESGKANECFYFQCSDLSKVSLPTYSDNDKSIIISEFQKGQKIIFISR